MSESSYGAAQGPRPPVQPYVPAAAAQDGQVWPGGPPSAPTQQLPGGVGGAGVLPRPPAPESAPVPSQQQPSRASMRAAAPRLGMSQQLRDGDLALDIALTRMVESGASDLHLTTGAPPMIRLNGTLQPLEGFAVLTGDVLQRSLYAVLTQKQRETFEIELELDFAYAVRGCARFRVNLYQQRESIGAAFRVIPYEIKPLEELGVPAVVGSFAGLPRGLVLVTGPTG